MIKNLNNVLDTLFVDENTVVKGNYSTDLALGRDWTPLLALVRWNGFVFARVDFTRQIIVISKDGRYSSQIIKIVKAMLEYIKDLKKSCSYYKDLKVYEFNYWSDAQYELTRLSCWKVNGNIERII